jgi:hypothetical protein
VVSGGKLLVRRKGAPHVARCRSAGAGFAMPPTRFLIFGSPKAGTQVMLASPAAAIDLPLKILVREDSSGGVLISYNTPEYIARRHHVPEGWFRISRRLRLWQQRRRNSG